MPKIPTYTSTSSMTTATPSVATDVPNLNVNNTPAGALQPISNFVRDSYIQEKTTEANNRSYKAINSFYEDQLDDDDDDERVNVNGHNKVLGGNQPPEYEDPPPYTP